MVAEADLTPMGWEYQTENHELIVRCYTVIGSQYVWINLFPVHKGNFPALSFDHEMHIDAARAMLRFLQVNVRRHLRRNAGGKEDAIDLMPNDQNRLIVVVNERDVTAVMHNLQRAIEYAGKLVLANA